MKTLETATLAELEAELEKRKLSLTKPAPKTHIDWNPVIREVEMTMDSFGKTGELPKNFEHYLYEVVIATVYGPDIWSWQQRATLHRQKNA